MIIQTLQKFKRTILGTVVIAMVAISMAGFGLGSFEGSGKSSQYAIRVDKKEISHEEFYRERRELEQRYRMFLGKNFQQFLQQANLNLNQTAADNLIAKSVLQKTAEDMGLAASDNDVARKIHRELFPQGYSQALYLNFLSQQRMTSAQFEQRVKSDLVREQLLNLIEDLSPLSKQELHVTIDRELTQFGVVALDVKAEDFLTKVPAQDETKLKSFYEDHSSEFELPARVSYDYIVLEAKQFPDLVQIPTEDIELYYTDNQKLFKNSDEVKARHIQLSIPKDASEDQKGQIKKHAEEILTKMKKGLPFAEAAKTYSDDVATKDQGGDLGWNTSEKFPKVLESTLLRMKTDAPPAIVTGSDAFHIVKADEVKVGSVKPLTEVRAQIEEQLKKEDAPAFLSARSEELLKEWAKANISLVDFAKSKQFTAASTNGFLREEVDPEPRLKGLTGKVLTASDLQSQSIDLPGMSVLVAVKEIKEPSLPELAEIKDKLIEKYKNQEGRKLAEQKTKDILQEMKDKKYPTLQAAAEAHGLSIKEIPELSAAKPSSDIKNPEALDSLMTASSPNAAPTRVFSDGGGMFSLYQVTTLKHPTKEEIEKKISESNVSKPQTDEITTASLLNNLKAKTDKDIDANILVSD